MLLSARRGTSQSDRPTSAFAPILIGAKASFSPAGGVVNRRRRAHVQASVILPRIRPMARKYQGLSRFGWSENRNLRIDYRYAAANAERGQQAVKELK